MPQFKFKVADAKRNVSERVVDADSQADAVRRLQRGGFMPLKRLDGGGNGGGKKAGPLFSRRRRFDLLGFTDRLASLLEAHVPLEKALAIVAENMKTDDQRQLVESMRNGLHEGRRFSAMLGDHSNIFPSLYISLVEVGEEAGAISQMTTELREFLIARREMRSYIVSASIYPAVVFAVSFLVLAVMLGLIVPRFATVFDVVSGGMRGPIKYLMALSDFVRTKWWTLPLAAAALVGVVAALGQNERFQKKWQRLLLGIPGVGRIVLLSNLARMTKTMAVLMRNGVHILDTVRISARVVQSRPIRDSMAEVNADLRRGAHLAAALATSEYIPQSMTRMLAIGDETGATDKMLEKLGDEYERELKTLVQRGLSLFEPALILSLGLVVTVIVVSMFLAIMDVQGGV